MAIFQATLSIYRQHLARFFIFRLVKAMVLSGYCLTYQLKSRLARCPESGIYGWHVLSGVGRDICTSKQTVFPSETIDVPTPKFVGYASDAAALRTPDCKISMPVMCQYELSPAMVMGGVDFVFAGNKAIHHDLFLPGEHHCPAENTGVISQRRSRSDVHLYLTKPALAIDAAATLIGQCSGNYAHWLTETLPKLPILDSNKESSRLPLLIDAGLHQNIRASIELINSNRRPIIQVARWQPMQVNRLLVVSSPGYERYVPQGIHSVEPAPFVNSFSRASLQLLRATVAESLGRSALPRTKRIYLMRSERSSNLRKLENAAVIEETLRRHDVLPVMPESMSFVEQVDVCLEAELIVAPVGAALANMIFAPEGCRVVILSPYYDDASYFYYANLAGALGHHVTYVLGPQVSTRQHPMHRNYRIDVDDLIAALRRGDSTM
jgi:capsular polysaccharide biosynthesis protein